MGIGSTWIYRQSHMCKVASSTSFVVTRFRSGTCWVMSWAEYNEGFAPSQLLLSTGPRWETLCAGVTQRIDVVTMLEF